MKNYFHGLKNPIERAETPPGKMYGDVAFYEAVAERVFLKNPFWIGHLSHFSGPENVFPIKVMPGMLNEPVIVVKTEAGKVELFSNVCTHRAAQIIGKPSQLKRLVCPYHGRRWGLDGHFQHMPGFEDALDFPRHCDDLPEHEILNYRDLLLGSLGKNYNLPDFSLLYETMGFFPMEKLRLKEGNPAIEYTIPVNWALYCENYLEGFHIPFVHPGLLNALDIKDYPIDTRGNCILQTGMADEKTTCFELPPNHRDFGKRVGAYYFFLFPGLMLNFYPWGLSVNEIFPNAVDKTVVRYSTYVLPGADQSNSAGAELDQVEFEDQEVVIKVQKSIGSRFYPGGRYSPQHERGVYCFHQLLADCFED